MKKICVFCGSSPGARPDYIEAAEQLGKELAGREITLIYGGASVGMMGRVARAAMREGGDVIGVIPRKLVDMEVAMKDLPDLRIVDSMHERKALMAELAQGFIALPGGLGTIEEFFEVLTWSQLGMHSKPGGLLNIRGYYDQLLAFLDHTVKEKFIENAHREMIITDYSPGGLLSKFENYRPPKANKAEWVKQMTSVIE